MMARLLLSISIMICACAHAATDECESRLAGDRYYRAFVRAMELRAVTVEDLRVVSLSETPFNPLQSVTATSRTAAAKAMFTTLIADKSVRAKWSETRARLSELLKQKTGEDVHRQEASRDTQFIVAPVELRKFKAKNFSTSVTEFGGETLIAYVSDTNHLEVMRASDGKILLSLDAGYYWQFRTGWQRDEKGNLFVYVVGWNPNEKSVSEFRRATLQSTELEKYKIEPQLPLGINTVTLTGVSPDLLLLHAGPYDSTHSFIYLNIAHNRASDISPWLWQTHHTEEPPPKNMMIATPRSPFSRTWVSPSGRKFHFSAYNGVLKVEGLDGQSRDFTLPAQQILPRDMAVTETAEGKILFAVTQKITDEQITLSLFDYDEGSKPYKTIPLHMRFGEFPQYFQDRDWNWYIGIVQYEWSESLLDIYSATDGGRVSRTSLPTTANHGGWKRIDGQTYFWVEDGNGSTRFYQTLTRP